MTFQKHINNVLHHLYINPLEKCNLKCRICYTKKTDSILTEKQILNFVERYNKEIKLKIITFCGGEVFVLPYFPHLVNTLIEKGIFIQIITNGTIDRLKELKRPNSINLIVSIDGLESYHNQNRGKDNFKKSINFLKKARELGFHTEIFSIITKQNLKQIDEFENFMKKELGNIEFTYHPRKSISYLTIHPVSNIQGEINGFDFLNNKELINLTKTRKAFPPKELGCYQISLMSDGKVYGCCEGFKSIGRIDEPVPHLIDRMRQNIKGPCLGCSQPDFMCGIKSLIS